MSRLCSLHDKAVGLEILGSVLSFLEGGTAAELAFLEEKGFLQFAIGNLLAGPDSLAGGALQLLSRVT